MTSSWRRSLWVIQLIWIFLSPFPNAVASRSKHKKEEQWEIVCFTCVNASDNYNCNRYAVDRPCPIGTDYCHSLHIFDESGSSLLVNKKCATRAECQPTDVGCFASEDSETTKCVACCDIRLCNQVLPTNETNAVLLTTRLIGEAPSLSGTINWHWMLLQISLTVHFMTKLYEF